MATGAGAVAMGRGQIGFGRGMSGYVAVASCRDLAYGRSSLAARVAAHCRKLGEASRARAKRTRLRRRRCFPTCLCFRAFDNVCRWYLVGPRFQAELRIRHH